MILEDRFDQAASLHRMAKAHAVHRFAVACTSLEGREMISLNAGAAFHPASTIKLAILAEAFHAAADGRLALDDRLEVLNRFSSLADGSPYQLDPADDADPGLYASVGGQTTVLELLRHMVGQGSNLAANLLLDRLGADQVTAFMRSLSASDLVVRRGVQDLRAYERGLNNSTTAGALQVLLLSLARGELVSPSASQAMIGLLLQERSREGIAELLPEEVRVAHKLGWTEAVYHDAAIVIPPERDPYVLVILTEVDPDRGRPRRFMAEASAAILHSW